MNKWKNLQVVLTMVLLILAAFALDWQERSIGENRRVEPVEARFTAGPAALSEKTDCCLKHALQAVEGLQEQKDWPGVLARLFDDHLLQQDSPQCIAAATIRVNPPTN